MLRLFLPDFLTFHSCVFFSFFLLLPLFVSSVLFLDTNSMSRESDDNLSSINSAYTGKQTNYFTYLHFIYIFSIIIFNLALRMRLTTHKQKERNLY